MFLKEDYDLKKMVQWLHFNDVIVLKDRENTVPNAHSLLESFLFQGIPVVIYKKGNDNIIVDVETFPEITDTFVRKERKMNTFNTKENHKLR